MAEQVVSDAAIHPHDEGYKTPGAVGIHMANLEQRFWNKVDKGDENECWEWTGATDGRGYGRIMEAGTVKFAHRISWKLHHSPAGGMHTLHKCDNPSCVNPAHLYVGTHQDNMADAVERDRFVKGEEVCTSKLSPADVVEIKRLLADGIQQKEIADGFGVARQTVGSIKSGKSWPHVEVEVFEEGTTPNRGENSPTAKFAREDVEEIKKRVENGEVQADLAREYGVHYNTINRIVNGKRWGHVGGDA